MTLNIGKDPVEITVDEEADGLRIDAYLGGVDAEVSRSKIQKMIRDGLITINNVACKAKEHLKNGDMIRISPPTIVKPVEAAVSRMFSDYKLDILYEDDSVIVVNKTAGMVVHDGAGESGPTLSDFLLKHCGQLSTVGGLDRPGIVHRLDKDTTGALVCAKNDEAHTHLAEQFKNKTNYREYTALLNGVLPSSSVSCSSYLGRDPKRRMMMKSWDLNEYHELGEDQRQNLKHSISHFKLTKNFFDRLSLVSVQLETGRTHQVRVHAHHLGCGIWGDPLYRSNPKLSDEISQDVKDSLKEVKRQLLHAKYIGFTHPDTNEKLAFEAPLPEDFVQVLKTLGGAS